MILADAAFSDGAWLWERAEQRPNLFFDLSWWGIGAILTLIGIVAPGQLLHASDAPYGTPIAGAVCMLRCCLQAGLTDAQIASVAGGQAERLLTGAEPLDLGPARRFARPTRAPSRTSSGWPSPTSSSAATPAPQSTQRARSQPTIRSGRSWHRCCPASRGPRAT